MRKTAVCLSLLAVAIRVDPHAQPATQRRHLLVVADDLHLEFRSTPCVRALITRTLQRSIRDGQLVGLVSTGTSAINVLPGSKADEVTSAVSRVIGSGLRPPDVLTAQQQPDVAAELRSRASIAFSKVANTIDTIASSPHNSIAVLYFSDGYLDGFTPQPTELMRSALRADVAIYTVDPRGLTGLQTPAGVTPEQWAAHVSATQDSLRTLALQTLGAPVTVDELNALLSRLAGTGTDGDARRAPRDEAPIDLPCHATPTR